MILSFLIESLPRLSRTKEIDHVDFTPDDAFTQPDLREHSIRSILIVIAVLVFIALAIVKLADMAAN